MLVYIPESNIKHGVLREPPVFVAVLLLGKLRPEPHADGHNNHQAGVQAQSDLTDWNQWWLSPPAKLIN